jgi:hypothetical protein
VLHKSGRSMTSRSRHNYVGAIKRLSSDHATAEHVKTDRRQSTPGCLVHLHSVLHSVWVTCTSSCSSPTSSARHGNFAHCWRTFLFSPFFFLYTHRPDERRNTAPHRRVSNYQLEPRAADGSIFYLSSSCEAKLRESRAAEKLSREPSRMRWMEM